jgi:hypothetical protein
MRNCEGRHRRPGYPDERWAEEFAEQLAAQRLDEALHAALAVAQEEFERELGQALADKEAEMDREQSVNWRSLPGSRSHQITAFSVECGTEIILSRTSWRGWSRP